MLLAHRIELEPNAEPTECDHADERETGGDDKSELRHEQERSDRGCGGDGGEDLPAQTGSDCIARHPQKRMRIRRRRRDHDVLLAASPQDRCRDEHEHPGNAEGDGGPEITQKDRHQERGEERAEIDNPIEGVEHHLRAVLVRLIELVPDERGHTRFNPARAERNQSEPNVKTGAVGHKHRQARLTCAVDEAQPENRVVFAKETVGQPAAEERKEVNADDEGVKHVLRPAGAFPLREIKEERRDEEDGENIPHPVKAEALASFISDDVANLLRNRRPRIGRNAGRRANFGLGYLLHDRERGQNRVDAQLQSGSGNGTPGVVPDVRGPLLDRARKSGRRAKAAPALGLQL